MFFSQTSLRVDVFLALVQVLKVLVLASLGFSLPVRVSFQGCSMLAAALTIFTAFKTKRKGKGDAVPKRESSSCLRIPASKGWPLSFTDQSWVTQPPRIAKKGRETPQSRLAWVSIWGGLLPQECGELAASAAHSLQLHVTSSLPFGVQAARHVPGFHL